MESLKKCADPRSKLGSASEIPRSHQISIARVSSCEDEVLQARLVLGRRSGTSEYLARFNEAEAGLLIFEEWPSYAFGLVYELQVLKPYRRLGIGVQLLKHADALALGKGFSSIRLQPRSLDRTHVTDQALVQWYGKHGYVVDELDVGWMRKAL